MDLFQGFFFARPASPPEQPQAVLTSDNPYLTFQLVPEGLDIDLAFSLDDRSLQGVLDSLGEQVAVIDRSGKIVDGQPGVASGRRLGDAEHPLYRGQLPRCLPLSGRQW